MNEKEKVMIYALASPDGERIRYVGASSQPKRRYYQHLGSATHRTRTPVGDWLLELKQQGDRPVLILLKEVPFGRWKAEERLWTSVLKLRGEPLLNRQNHLYHYSAVERRRCRVGKAPRWQPVRGRGRKKQEKPNA